MADRIRAFDWSTTSLGAIDGWSPRLTVMVEQVLACPLPSSIVCSSRHVLIYNDAAAPLCGGRHPDALGRPVPDTFPDTWPVMAPNYERAFSGESVRIPAQPLDLGGGEVFDAYLTPVRDEAGAVIAAHMVSFEISGRLRTEAALRASEDRLVSALEGGEVGAWELDLVTLEAWRSPQHDRIFGYEAPLPCWTYDIFLDHILPEDRGAIIASFQEAVATDGTCRFEGRIRRRDGALRWIGAQGRIGASADGRHRCLKGTVRDITDRKTTEAALRESEERFRGLVEGFGQFSWEARADGVIVVDSPGWRAHTGQTLDQWQGYGWTDAIHPDDRDGTQRKWRAAVAAGRMVDSEYRLWHAPSGSWRWSNVRAVPITDRAGTVVKWAGVNIDITDRRALQVRQEVLVNELQHRARNLLAVVAAITDRTMRQDGSVETFTHRLQALGRAQGLLSLGGSDTVEVGALIRAELAAYTGDAPDGIEIDGPEVHLRARQVQNFALAVHELATNAVKHGALKGEGGTLRVTWDVAPDQPGRRRLALSWVEGGVAMPPEGSTHRGYGTELIREALAYALQANVDYVLGTDGVLCRIEMPISGPRDDL